MKTITLIGTRGGQVVVIPREFCFACDEVEIYRDGDAVVLRPVRRDLSEALAILANMPDDFMADGRVDVPPQDREAL